MINPTPGACLLQDRTCSPGRSCLPGEHVVNSYRRQVQNSSLLLRFGGRPRPRTEREKEEPMAKNAFWTRRRFTGITLILGCFLFLGAAGLIPRDAQGNFMVNLPLREQLLVIAAQTSLSPWSFSLFIIGRIVTLLGLAM